MSRVLINLALITAAVVLACLSWQAGQAADHGQTWTFLGDTMAPTVAARAQLIFGIASGAAIAGVILGALLDRLHAKRH